MSADDGRTTPEGLEVVARNYDDETISVISREGLAFTVRNVAEEIEPRDRYSVVVDGAMYTDELRAPERPGPEWSSDPMGSAADAAVSFFESDRA